MAFNKSFKPQIGGAGRYTLSGLKSGEKVKVRILSEFISGLTVWSDLENGKRAPLRVRDGEPIPVGKIGNDPKSGEPERIRQFVAGVCWNYATEQVEIFETSKATIIEVLWELEGSEDWGDVREYDLTISKSGQGMDTKYSVLPSNKTPLKVKPEWKTVRIDALYENADPFNSESVPRVEKTDAEKVADDFVNSLS